ncbi:MAG: bifunctional molybdenum cofactor biosynthesis protein MoaC/MoaB [Nitritalea sp.]
MVDITHKTTTLRKAIAQAVVLVSRAETIQAIQERRVPKGDVLEMAKVAGLFAAKRTADMIPDCHPLPIEFATVRYSIEGLEVRIEMEIHTIYKTGVEVEAMHAASVVALTMYDMLKPIDKGVEISSIRLLKKTGGKTDYATLAQDYKVDAAVFFCAEDVLNGKKSDEAGQVVRQALQAKNVQIKAYQVLPESAEALEKELLAAVQAGRRMVIVIGSSGFTQKDMAAQVIRPLLQRPLPGIEETIRRYGQERTPYAMFSHSVAGMLERTLVLSIPGSTAGAKESMAAIFPAVLHIFRVQDKLDSSPET